MKVWISAADEWPLSQGTLDAAEGFEACQIISLGSSLANSFGATEVGGLEIVPAADSVDVLLDKLAVRRREATEMFTWDGVMTPADAAIPALTGAVVAMQMPGAPTSIKWKLGKNEFRMWSFMDLVIFGTAVRAHIQACFDHESNLTDQILNGDEVDINAGWP